MSSDEEQGIENRFTRHARHSRLQHAEDIVRTQLASAAVERPIDLIADDESSSEDFDYTPLSADDRFFLEQEYKEEMQERPVRIGSTETDLGVDDDNTRTGRRKRAKHDVPQSGIPVHLLLQQSNAGQQIQDGDVSQLTQTLQKNLMSRIDADQQEDPLDEFGNLIEKDSELESTMVEDVSSHVLHSTFIRGSAPLQTIQSHQTFREDPTVDNLAKEDYKDSVLETSTSASPPAPSTCLPNRESPQIRSSDEGRLFYIIDEQELRGAPGILFLFGKIIDPLTARAVTASVRVEGLSRTIHILAAEQFYNPATGLNERVTQRAVEEEISRYLGRNRQLATMDWPVLYFPFDGVPEAPEQGQYLRVVLPASIDVESILPCVGKTYRHIFGLTTKLSEIFNIRFQIKGPEWISLLQFSSITTQLSLRNTYCQNQFLVRNPSDIAIIHPKDQPPPPRLRLLMLNLQTSLNIHTKQQQIVMISGQICDDVHPNGSSEDAAPASTSEEISLHPLPPHFVPFFTLICPIAETKEPLPPTLKQQEALQALKKPHQEDPDLGSYRFCVKENEVDLLKHFAALVGQCDPDIIAGYNLIPDILGLIVRRLDAMRQNARKHIQGSSSSTRLHIVPDAAAKHEKVLEDAMKKLGRLKRAHFPAVQGNADLAVQTATSGRLLCDLTISAKEFRRERNYQLPTLVRSVLQMELEEIDQSHLKRAFETVEGCLSVMNYNELIGQLVYEILMKMNVLPLTKQLANITGTNWARVLVGGRAERAENLLVHWYSQERPDVILPDKREAKQWRENGSLPQHGKEEKEEEHQLSSMGNGLLDRIRRAKKVEQHNKTKKAMEESKEAEEVFTGMDGIVRDDEADNDEDDHDIEEDLRSLSIVNPSSLSDAARTEQTAFGPSSSSQDGSSQKKRRKKAAYTGGRVLDAKTGFYDNYILLLDFNSLYPSIIQEMNVCHTTIARGDYDEQFLNDVPISTTRGVIPKIVDELLDRRKQVKREIKTEKKHAATLASNQRALKMVKDRLQVLDTTQLAFKIVANSMYGCFGFEKWRFYAKRLAQIITFHGRKMLTEARVRVEKQNFEVIYGDTDSLMIDMKSTDLIKTIEAGHYLSKLVNQGRGYLHIDIDGIFSSLLLLSKKKYAAMKMQSDVDDVYTGAAQAQFKMEVRGVEIVRRDWCQITRAAETQLLRILLGDDGPSKHEIASLPTSSSPPGAADVPDEAELEKEMENSAVGRMDTYLRELSNRLRSGDWSRTEFEITKSIFKPPEDYPDPNHQPHVLVALEMKNRLNKMVHPGDAIPYIICAGSKDWAQRAHHPSLVVANGKDAKTVGIPSTSSGEPDDESTIDNPSYLPDLEWYFSQQIHPAILRLTSCVDGMDAIRLADCLGMDTSRYMQARRYDPNTSAFSYLGPGGGPQYRFISTDILGMEQKFKQCQPLHLACSKCDNVIALPPPLTADVGITSSSSSSSSSDFPLICPYCRSDVPITSLLFPLQMLVRRVYSMHFNSPLECDDPLCSADNSIINLRRASCSGPDCNGIIQLKYDEEQLYLQLLYLKEIFTPSSYKNPSYGHLVPHVLFGREQLKPVIDILDCAINQCNFSRVNLEDVFSDFIQ